MTNENLEQKHNTNVLEKCGIDKILINLNLYEYKPFAEQLFFMGLGEKPLRREGGK